MSQALLTSHFYYFHVFYIYVSQKSFDRLQLGQSAATQILICTDTRCSRLSQFHSVSIPTFLTLNVLNQNDIKNLSTSCLFNLSDSPFLKITADSTKKMFKIDGNFSPVVIVGIMKILNEINDTPTRVPVHNHKHTCYIQETERGNKRKLYLVCGSINCNCLTCRAPRPVP